MPFELLGLPDCVSSWSHKLAPGVVEPIPAIPRRDGVSLGREQNSVPVRTRHLRAAWRPPTGSRCPPLLATAKKRKAVTAFWYKTGMGQLFGFQCSACGYAAQVSGGPDTGMTCLTQTVRCGVCCQLLDVEVSDTPWDQLSKKTVRKIPCPKCGGSTLEPWDHPGPCPRCGRSSLDRGDLILLWD